MAGPDDEVAPVPREGRGLDPAIRLRGLQVADHEIDLAPTQHLEQHVDAVRDDGHLHRPRGPRKARHCRRHEHLGGIDARPNPEFVGAVTLQEFHLALEVADLGEHHAGSREEHPPSVGRVDPIAAAPEEDAA